MNRRSPLGDIRWPRAKKPTLGDVSLTLGSRPDPEKGVTKVDRVSSLVQPNPSRALRLIGRARASALSLGERAGTIWSVIIVHAVFDLAAISASGSVDALLEPGLETYMRFLSVAVVFTAWGSGAIYLIGRRARREAGIENGLQG